MNPNYLDQLARKHGTDKHSDHHDYCRHYQKHFEHLRGVPVNLIEFGIGGYEYPDRGGGGLKMWDEFFTHPQAKITGIDLYNKSGLKFGNRVKILKGSQNDGDFLLKMFVSTGAPDIIIDDASHMNNLTIQTFRHCFPWLKPKGIYVIEDIESSWWNEHGFDGQPDPNDFMHPSSINFCRALINILNVKHIAKDENGNPQTPYHLVKGGNYEIDSMHFYNNMVVIIKK